jgi:hypothetical protein
MLRRSAPVLVLAALAVVVPEILFGSTPLPEPGRILVTLPIYAGGALLIRELARRRRVGWIGIAMLGAAYGLIEEGLVLGSIFSPNLFNAALVGGRLFGVNWTWTQWTLGYHAVWSISIPILLTELLFPDRRTEPWLGRIGLAVAGLVYLVGVIFMTLIMRLAVDPGFSPPLIPYIAAGVIAVGLALLALRQPGALPLASSSAASTASRQFVPPSWLVAGLSLIVAGAWFGLLLLPGPVKSTGWVVLPMVLALALVTGLVVLVRRWSGSLGWTDLHRLALASGPLVVHTLYGIVYVAPLQTSGRVSHAVASAVAAVLLTLFAYRLRERSGSRDEADHPIGDLAHDAG